MRTAAYIGVAKKLYDDRDARGVGHQVDPDQVLPSHRRIRASEAIGSFSRNPVRPDRDRALAWVAVACGVPSGYPRYLY